MTNLYQVVWNWSGTTGGTGYTNLFYEVTDNTPTEALAACTKSRLLFSGMGSLLPNAINLTLSGDVRVIDDATGDLQTIYTVVGPAPVVGSGGTSYYVGPAGGCIDWLTGVVHGKHMMTGRTFFVPLYAVAYQNDGTLAPATVTQMGTAAEAMRTASGPAFGVWGRPRTADPDHVPPISGLAGHWAPAISSRVPDKSVVLRSRRD